jgi:hypothetical protein
MSTEAWIAIAAIIIQLISQFGATLWQIRAARADANPATNQPRQQADQSKIKSRLPYRWKFRVAIFFVNIVAAYFLVREILNPAPLSRASVVIIAAETGVIVICFILPLFLGVYEYIENNL